MDPFTIYRLGLIRQQEILDWAARYDTADAPLGLRRVWGQRLIALGERLLQAAQPQTQADCLDIPHMELDHSNR